MPNSPGKVYASDEPAGGAVFLDGLFLGNLHAYIEGVIGDPETSDNSKLEVSILERLAAVMGDAPDAVSEAAPPTVLPAADSGYLDLLLRQPYIWQSLPFRLQAKCKVCRQTRVVDPARRERRRREQGHGEISMSNLAGIVSALSEHHSLQAALRVKGEIDRLNHMQGESVVCSKCDGDEFDFKQVTFCPECGKLRAETILTRCRDCSFDYQTLVTGDIWEPAEAATGRFRVAVKQQTIVERAPSVYVGVLEDQVRDLLDLAPDEQLIALCHCAIAPDTRPFVLLLLTSDRVAWSRATPILGKWAGSQAAGALWADVTAVESPPDRPGSVIFWFSGGQQASFSLFQGEGADLAGSGLVLDSAGVGQVAGRLIAQSRAKTG